MTRPANGCRSGVQKPESTLLASLQAKLAANDPIRGRLPASVKVYCVGGAVRDALLGQPSTDLDFVVVGADAPMMLAAGFTPVGKDFPVFLHPISHDEYALARTERKSGKGYKGFVIHADPSVSLADDLSRRDLTINAMAVDAQGELIDPHGGLQDLAQKTLRHIGAAFSEDPVRMLRLARFAARWPSFTVAQDTLKLCNAMVASGEADALVPERVWQEISKGLMEPKPSRMIEVLAACGAWSKLHANIGELHPRSLQMLDQAAHEQLDLAARYALMVHHAHGTPGPTDLFKAPADAIDMAALLCKQHATLRHALDVLGAHACPDPQPLLDWLMSCDITRKMARFHTLLSCLVIEQAIDHLQRATLERLAAALTSEQANQAVARAASEAQANGRSVADAVAAARLASLRQALQHNA